MILWTRREALIIYLHFADSERPVLFSPEEIEEATSFFNESRKIGEGGYGSVYFGILGGKVWQVHGQFSFLSPLTHLLLYIFCTNGTSKR